MQTKTLHNIVLQCLQFARRVTAIATGMFCCGCSLLAQDANAIHTSQSNAQSTAKPIVNITCRPSWLNATNTPLQRLVREVLRQKTPLRLTVAESPNHYSWASSDDGAPEGFIEYTYENNGRTWYILSTKNAPSSAAGYNDDHILGDGYAVGRALNGYWQISADKTSLQVESLVLPTRLQRASFVQKAVWLYNHIETKLRCGLHGMSPSSIVWTSTNSFRATLIEQGLSTNVIVRADRHDNLGRPDRIIVSTETGVTIRELRYNYAVTNSFRPTVIAAQYGAVARTNIVKQLKHIDSPSKRIHYDLSLPSLGPGMRPIAHLTVWDSPDFPKVFVAGAPSRTNKLSDALSSEHNTAQAPSEEYRDLLAAMKEAPTASATRKLILHLPLTLGFIIFLVRYGTREENAK